MRDTAPDARFPKSRRLLKAGDYSRVFENAQTKASHKYLLFLATSNDGPGHRLGLVIAKKNVRLAVERNRIKRIVREFFRTLPGSEPAMDVVLLARPGIDQLDNAELSSILLRQWQKLCQLIPKPELNTSRDL